MSEQSEAAWQSYLLPGTQVLRTLPQLATNEEVAVYERIVSNFAEQELHRFPIAAKSFDLEHLNALHARLFADVYPFAGQLRYVNVLKPGQVGEAFLNHPWIGTYTGALVDQLRTEKNLVQLSDPGRWADRAAYYWAGLNYAHPYREGNGRTIRLWLQDPAGAAGHSLDWSRIDASANIHVAQASMQRDIEPMRCMLRVVAGAGPATDRASAGLDAVDTALRVQCWAQTGVRHGTGKEQRAMADQLDLLEPLIPLLRQAIMANAEAPLDRGVLNAAERWRGVAVAIDPALPADPYWPTLAAALDHAAAEGQPLRSVLEVAHRTPLEPEHPARCLHYRLSAENPAIVRAAQPATPVRPVAHPSEKQQLGPAASPHRHRPSR